jgi:hypothetical protein
MKILIFCFALMTLTACQTSTPMELAYNLSPTAPQEKWCQDEAHRSFDEDAYFANFE